MRIRTAATAVVLSLSLSSVPAFAAEEKDAVGPATPAEAVIAGATPPADVEWSVGHVLAASDRRPAVLPMLYVSFAALQAYDGYSTRQALGHGGQETNASMQTVASHSGMLWAVKAGMATGAVLIAERMWKQNKVAAIAMMVAANGVAAIVAAHNASVLKQLR